MLGAANKGTLSSVALHDVFASQKSGTMAFYTLTASVTDIPFSDGNGCNALIIKYDNAAGRIFAWHYQQNTTYFQIKSGNSWSDWQRVYDTSILTDSTILSPLASALKPYL